METTGVALRCLAHISPDVRRPAGRGVAVGFRSKWVLLPSLPIPLPSPQLKNFPALPRIIMVASWDHPCPGTLHTGHGLTPPHGPQKADALLARPCAGPRLHPIPSLTSTSVQGVVQDGPAGLAGLVAAPPLTAPQALSSVPWLPHQ